MAFADALRADVIVLRDRAQETLAVGRRQIEHQPRRLAVAGGEREGLVDPHRALGVEHDARAALHDQPVAERLHQAAALLAGLGRQLEGDLRQIDHHPIGIGQGEGREIELLAEVDHHTGLLVVAADPDVARDRERVGRRGGSRQRAGPLGGRRQSRHEQARADDADERDGAKCHESDPFAAVLPH